MTAHFLLKRLLALPLLVFGTASAVFFIIRMLPGDPMVMFLSPSIPADVADHVRRAFGLDRSLPIQYCLWIREVCTGSLGYSFTFQADVLSVIAAALPSTIVLATSVIVVELGAAFLLAFTSARWPKTALDRFISMGGLVTYTMPTFWIAFLLIQIFSVHWAVLPSSHLHSVSAEGLSTAGYLLDQARHLVLPIATLALPGAAGMALFLRSSIATIAKAPFVTVARSMGITERRIFYSYVMPNALSSVVTLSGLSFGSLLTGALITESIFALPGMGRLIVTAIFARDYPLVVGCVITASVLYIGVNIITDIAHYLIDPRIARPHG